MQPCYQLNSKKILNYVSELKFELGFGWSLIYKKTHPWQVNSFIPLQKSSLNNIAGNIHGFIEVDQLIDRLTISCL